ncbi:MAG: hypothetical protein J6W74_02990 [Bacteroidales bacterium]|nr:hypothetical protein [Bacteroidales bacterium]
MTVFTASAQHRLYLFSEFKPAAISFRGYSRPEQVVMNIDAKGQKILYLQGETLMELTNAFMIDSLIVEGRKFVMKDGLLCEELALQSGTLYVNWKLKNVNKGSRGALGATTQAKVEVLHSYEFTPATPFPVNDWHLYSEDGDGGSVEIWERKGDNTYFFSIDGTEYKVKKLKDIYNAFPDVAKQLKSFAKSNQLTMENAADAIRVIEHLRTLL